MSVEDEYGGELSMAGAISAAILAGGQSRRMGADKAMMDWDGEPLLGRIIHIVRCALPVHSELFVVGYRAPYTAFGVEVCADAFPGTGPLGGIATALGHSEAERVLVLGCDMPLLSVDLLRAMVEHETEADVLVPGLPGNRSEQGGPVTLETMHAIYRTRCLPAIRRCLDRGDFKSTAFFDSVEVEVLEQNWIRQYDPDLVATTNVNRPEDIERARSYSDQIQ